ncbi:MAG: 16S rRNA (guanine(527)-N(7))-methyltransferase RsmG [Chloroflexi bacterium]|nr:16S rRNA (guanine(527)-N(7))-methyltransferase RsmG [Chloroflexota bacterium]
MEPLAQLVLGAQRLGITITQAQLRQFHRYQEELLSWNKRVNLTAITCPEEIETLHFLDSLTVAMALPAHPPTGYRVCDVGTGAGFPGVPLKIAFPDIRLTLVEATAKKAAFLEHLAQALGLESIAIHTGRAEDLAHAPDLREAFDLVTARAVAGLPSLLELTLPFCRTSGLAVAPKKGNVAEEVASAARALQELGGRLVELRPIPEDVLPGSRVLVIVEKAWPTPPKYPRRPGMPAKRPL